MVISEDLTLEQLNELIAKNTEVEYIFALQNRIKSLESQLEKERENTLNFHRVSMKAYDRIAELKSLLSESAEVLEKYQEHDQDCLWKMDLKLIAKIREALKP